MDKGLIPRRYAKALLEVATERKDDLQMYTLMQGLAAAFAETKGLAATLANPFVEKADKEDLLTKAVYGAKGKPDATYEDFLRLLAQNGRLDLAREIAQAYIRLYREAHSIFRVEIESASPLTPDEKSRLQGIIEQHVGKGTFEYGYTVNPALIGGFSVTVNSERLDASVATRLKQLRLNLVR